MQLYKLKLSRKVDPKSFRCPRQALKTRKDGLKGYPLKPCCHSDPTVTWFQTLCGKKVPVHCSEIILADCTREDDDRLHHPE